VVLLIRYETETSEWEMTWDVGFLIPVGCRSRRDELKSLHGRPEEDDQHAEHQPRCDNVGPYIFRPGRRRIQTVPQRSEKQHCAESANYPPNRTPAARYVTRLCSSYAYRKRLTYSTVTINLPKPRRTLFNTRCSASMWKRLTFRASALNRDRISSLARCTPRHPCGPAPNAM
jgi:hypothetical protein